MTSIVLQIETSAGTKVEVPLRVGANEILADSGSQYRLTAIEEAPGSTPWNPQAYREEDDLVIQGAVENQTLVLQNFFSVCTAPQVCQLEVVPSSGLASTISSNTPTIDINAAGQALVYDAALIQIATEDSGINWVNVGLGSGAAIGLLAAAGGGGNDNGNTSNPTPTPEPTIQDPDPIRLAGTKLQNVEIEGGDQVITSAEAGPQDRLVITVTVNEPVSEILNTDLFWDSPSGEPTQISNADFLAEPDETTSTIRVSVNVFTRQNGTTVEEGNGLTELDIVLYSNDANGEPFVSGRASIPLRLSFETADGTSTTALLNPELESGDEQASILSRADLLSDSALFLSAEAASVLGEQPASQYGEAVSVEVNRDLLANQSLPTQI